MYDQHTLGTWHQHEGCLRLKVAGDVVAKKDDIAVIDLTTDPGYVIKGASGTGLLIVGTFAEDVDTTGKSNGDPFGAEALVGPALNLAMSNRLFWFDNSAGGDAITQADVGKPAYINGARAVTDTSTSRSLAGTIVDLSPDATKVRVALLPLGALPS